MTNFQVAVAWFAAVMVGTFVLSPAIAWLWRYGQRVQRRRGFGRADRRVLDGLAKIGASRD